MGPEALLKALAEWVRAEAADVRIASPRANAAAAKRYVALLGDWAGRIGGTQRWAIPRVSKGLRQAARAVSEEREGRFDLAVQLYRRELNKKGAVVRKDSRRARTDAEQVCAVRAAALPSVRCGRVLRLALRWLPRIIVLCLKTFSQNQDHSPYFNICELTYGPHEPHG